MPRPLVLDEDEAMELLAFLVSAARIQLDEPARYGPMRLLTAAERLSQLAKERALPDARQTLEAIFTQISEMQEGRGMTDHDEYAARLDALCRTVARHLVERTGLARGTS